MQTWDIETGHTRRGIGLQSGDDSGLGDLIRATVVHIDSLEQQNIGLLSHARSDGLHNFAIDRLLVIRDKVLVQKLLNLVGREPRKLWSA